jgi:hypothetical protein
MEICNADGKSIIDPLKQQKTIAQSATTTM